eukprot:431662-Pyramimonas_sp.AAC.1
MLGRPRAPAVAASRCVFPGGPPRAAPLTRGQLLAKHGLDVQARPHYRPQAAEFREAGQAEGGGAAAAG